MQTSLDQRHPSTSDPHRFLRVRAHTHTRTRTHTYTHRYRYTHTHTHTRTHTDTDTHTLSPFFLLLPHTWLWLVWASVRSPSYKWVTCCLWLECMHQSVLLFSRVSVSCMRQCACKAFTCALCVFYENNSTPQLAI